MFQPAHTRGLRKFTAGALLAVIAGVLLLAQLAIPCATPSKPRMSSKFDAMCKPPAFTAKANAEFLLKIVTPEPLRLLAFAALLVVGAAFLFRHPARDPHRPRPARGPRIRDGSRLPFVTSARLFVQGLIPLRDH